MGPAGAAPGDVAIAVPCFNEAQRIDPAAVHDLVDRTSARVLLVDDGSTDGTPKRLHEIAAGRPGSIEVVELTPNAGKGEAVRIGLLAGLDGRAQIVAYCDADFAAPPAEIARLIGIVRARSDLDVLIGSRVGLLGHDIRRSLARHYLGRLFATASSLALRLQVYDTQCGAKVMRATPTLRRALAEPFRSRWAFDVELLARLVRPRDGHGIPAGALLEVPLESWRDVGGSRLDAPGAALAVVELARLAMTHRRS